jgi:hypothetical protein
MQTRLIALFLTIGITLVFYLSWLPQPQLGLSWIIPAWLAKWADNPINSTFRTSVPFFFLGLLTGLWLIRVPFSFKRHVLFWLFLVLIVLIA